jgi:rare lipoprotein A
VFKTKYLISFWGILFFFGWCVGSWAQLGYQQKGIASYYHQKFQGRRTSSGQRLSHSKLTAAHRTLNFNSVVRVTNLKNDRSVVVIINDRGPYKYKKRIIDLTWAAAKKIGLHKSGTALVKIEVIGEHGKIHFGGDTVHTLPGSFEIGKCYSFRGEKRNPRGYGVQVAAFTEVVNARYYAQSLYEEGFKEIVIKVVPFHDGLTLYKVIVGERDTRKKALTLLKKLGREHFVGFICKY